MIYCNIIEKFPVLLLYAVDYGTGMYGYFIGSRFMRFCSRNKSRIVYMKRVAALFHFSNSGSCMSQTKFAMGQGS